MAHRIPSQAFRLPINRFLSSSTTHASSINSLRRGLNRPQIPNASAPAMPVDLFGHHDLMVRASKTVEGQELGRRWLGSSAANRIDSDRVCSFIHLYHLLESSICFGTTNLVGNDCQTTILDRIEARGGTIPSHLFHSLHLCCPQSGRCDSVR